ncbi:hypothetical protein EC973_007810 [Apophysomyces ossiformis]|uniref:alpha-galactosidase n=1 Tax=Apophysomyces ossiformis TaxID=679940 RepID=A0A8H7BUB7_9FUNG|nr:hypothetical protein EC973_007810 [Apophysomyces ossiformis]
MQHSRMPPLDVETNGRPWANKPLLGFSTWSTQLLHDIPGYGGTNIKPWFNERNIREISDVMKTRLPQYKYINLDSGWCTTYDDYGRWIYREDLFPSGLKSLADYLAKNGHFLGLYILPGIRQDAANANMPIKGTTRTLGEFVSKKKEGCGFKGLTYLPDEHNEWIQTYYDSIGDLFAEWGIRYVKVDGCGPGGGSPLFPNQSPDNRASLRMMYSSFQKHNIWMELSWYLDYKYAEEWAHISNGARIYVDIESYSGSTMTSSYRVFERISQSALWVDTHVIGKQYGFYVDLDSVLVGMTVDGKCIDGLDNDDIRQTYISFWALVSSVFCIGSDPRCLPDKYLRMLNHPDILSIHQSGIMARPVGDGNAWNNRKQVWYKTLPDGRICCGLFNTHVYSFMLGMGQEVTVKLASIGLSAAEIIDVWTAETIGTYNDSYTIYLRPGQCQMLYLVPK